MSGQHRYPRTIVLVFLMVLLSFGVMGKVDSRLHIGGSDWEPELFEVAQFAVFDSVVDDEAQKDEPKADESKDDLDDVDGLTGVVKEPEAVISAPSSQRKGVSDTATEKGKTEEKKEERPPVFVHKVRSGETLWDIARAYGVTVEAILSANDISNPSRISVGQELKVLSVQGVLHQVAVGESLWEIAQRYKVSMDEIVKVNEIDDPAKIQPRTQIIVPGATRVIPRDVLVASGQLQKAFDWPTRGRISSNFGMRWGRMHNGVDIAIPVGTPLRAAADGRVTFSGWNGGYGILVIIDHGNGVETRYAHNSRNVVNVGQRVERGQIISYSGNTGNSTGPHVHFEIRYKGQPVNPTKYLR